MGADNHAGKTGIMLSLYKDNKYKGLNTIKHNLEYGYRKRIV